jgi:glutathione S-transferase
MTAATAGPSGKLEVRRIIAAPRERVFEAFAQQEQMDRWMCRDAASHTIKYLQFDFRVGGGFVLDIRTPDGDIYIHHSTYIEIKRPEKISFTWNLEHTDAAGHKAMLHPKDTIVTVELFERGRSTEVVLNHDLGVTSAKERGDYQRGWTGCLEKLAEAVEK